jgi:hypothetical protein
MKRIAAILAALAAAGCSVAGVRTAAEPRYDVVATLGPDVEIRRYAPRVAVEARLTDAGGDPRSRAFGLLFDYIAGANDGGAKIAMTAPVATDEAAGVRMAMTAPVAEPPAEGGFAMRFFLPDGYAAGGAPRPSDPRLTLVALPEAEVAALRFSGLRSAAALEAAAQRLDAALAPSAWRPAGPPEAWFYDPPWTLPPLRRNEIAVPVVRG